MDLFLRLRRRQQRVRRGDPKALERLLTMLRQMGVVKHKPPAPDTVHSRIVGEFQRYLLQEGGLSPLTLVNYVPVVDGRSAAAPTASFKSACGRQRLYCRSLSLSRAGDAVSAACARARESGKNEMTGLGGRCSKSQSPPANVERVRSRHPGRRLWRGYWRFPPGARFFQRARPKALERLLRIKSPVRPRSVNCLL